MNTETPGLPPGLPARLRYARAYGVACIACVFTPAVALAQPHRGDILLTIADGRIQTGSIHSDGSLDPNVRVFQTALGVVAPNYTADPGFDCLPGTFPVTSRNGFIIHRALRIWNGTDFDGVSPSRMSVSFATLSATTPTDDQPVTGFTLAVGSNGQWHKHMDYDLLLPADTGVYLLELSLFSTASDIGESLPFWMVFNDGADQSEADSATQWVRDHLLAPPCAADFNGDGGVDGADVEAFFVAWESADAGADVNQDGGVDGGDVEAFFTVWQAGGC